MSLKISASAEWRACVERGIALRRAGEPRLAIGWYRRAINLDPDNPTAWTCLGNALKDAGRLQEAIEAQRNALRGAPDSPALLFNLAVALRQVEAWYEALATLDRALAMEPHSAEMQWERALLQLQIGNYRAGFAEYGARFRLPQGPASPPVSHKLQEWLGQDPAEATVVVLPEQGFGDSFLAMRYVIALPPRGARVVLHCRPETQRLFATTAGVTTCNLNAPLPQSGYVVPMMALPGLIQTSATNIPPPWVPTPDAEACSKAATLLPQQPGLHVGICWAGSDGFADNARRSVPLSVMLGLLELPGIVLHSLQKGPHTSQAASAEAAGLLHPLAEHCEDFAETAAAIARLDLVVTTDSAVAHLSASIGTPTWVLLHAPPYWIYGTGGDRTAWYPGMRLFRQPKPGDWGGVLDQVINALRTA